jgi:hypothetical protein
VLVDVTSVLQEQVERHIDPETGTRAAAVAVLAGSVVRNMSRPDTSLQKSRTLAATMWLGAGSGVGARDGPERGMGRGAGWAGAGLGGVEEVVGGD